jgi:hypothetical protein
MTPPTVLDAALGCDRDRVRRNTTTDVLRRIDDELHDRLSQYESASSPAVAERLRELDHEWDTDRVIELEAAATGVLGLALGTLVRTNLLAIPAFVGAALVLHAVTGRYPLMPVLRRLGVRTSREIARERYALKALRGDFVGVEAAAPASSRERTEAA